MTLVPTKSERDLKRLYPVDTVFVEFGAPAAAAALRGAAGMSAFAADKECTPPLGYD